MAKQFGMKVWGFTVSSETSTHVDRYFHPTSPLSFREPQWDASRRAEGEGLTGFAAGLDYLVIVLPRTNDTNKIVDANVLQALRSHAVVVNVGRGECGG